MSHARIVNFAVHLSPVDYGIESARAVGEAVRHSLDDIDGARWNTIETRAKVAYVKASFDDETKVDEILKQVHNAALHAASCELEVFHR